MKINSVYVSYGVLIFLIISLSTVGYIAEHNSEQIIEVTNHLTKLQHNVFEANQAVRQAAMAPTTDLVLKEYEITKRTTKSSLEIYQFLLSSKLLNKREMAIVNEQFTERRTYKYVQSKVKWLILEGASKEDIWTALNKYQFYQDRYQSRVTSLVNSMRIRVNKLHNMVMISFASILSLVAGVLVFEKYLIYKGQMK